MKKNNFKFENALAKEELEKNFFFVAHVQEQIERIKMSDMTHSQKNGALQLISLEIRDFLRKTTGFEPGDEIPF